ncbi:MAG TPA: outer membrane lipid asymmetry maintenance protein MlaD [Rhizomicrobium sp.]|jgi:phospholipid/cholesterol/gamma-HCH transport system substrate-binding protein|nr:outer membrane lipid asymmetry maintenance protein MlaD [Rhizomicrobium sp.]
MQNNTVETLIGAIVIAVAVVFLGYAYTTTNSGGVSGYEVTAQFGRIDGVNVGTDVRLSGVKVGTVAAIELDPKTYLADVKISIRNGVEIPDDSAVKVTSSGLLASSYLSIAPGGSDTMIKPDGRITNTQGSVDLIGLVSRAMMGSGSDSGPATGKPQNLNPPQNNNSPQNVPASHP